MPDGGGNPIRPPALAVNLLMSRGYEFVLPATMGLVLTLRVKRIGITRRKTGVSSNRRRKKTTRFGSIIAVKAASGQDEPADGCFGSFGAAMIAAAY